MFIKLITGPRAGEIVEMNYLDAKYLLDDGRAELAFPPDPPAPGVSPEAVEKVESSKASSGSAVKNQLRKQKKKGR